MPSDWVESVAAQTHREQAPIEDRVPEQYALEGVYPWKVVGNALVLRTPEELAPEVIAFRARRNASMAVAVQGRIASIDQLLALNPDQATADLLNEEKTGLEAEREALLVPPEPITEYLLTQSPRLMDTSAPAAYAVHPPSRIEVPSPLVPEEGTVGVVIQPPQVAAPPTAPPPTPAAAATAAVQAFLNSLPEADRQAVLDSLGM